jgi:NAD(P)-dependent dehydrogenase (short-subunit alcohol dehydrogenase family)
MKTMLITGASRGIGAATALMAAEEGYAVVVNYRRNEAAAQKITDAIAAKGGVAIAVRADISVEADVIKLFEETDRRFGRPDCLVNNAGILETQMRLEEMDVQRLSRIFTANITGQFICAREAVKRMAFRHGGKGGSIVNISSVAAKTGAPFEYLDYAASKGAIDTFTLGLAKETAAEGIRVNAVRPGFIYTDIHADGGEPGRVDRVKHNVPMQRGGQAEEAAAAILWLASDKASYTTGTFIDVAGGR